MGPSERRLKNATNRLIEAAGGQEAAADSTRVSQQQIGRYGHLQHAETYMPIDVVVGLEILTRTHPDHPILTRALARIHGVYLVRGAGRALTPENLAAALGHLSKETGDVFRRAGAMIADPAELTDTRAVLDLIREIDEAAEALIAAKELLLDQSGEGI
ncbi:MAG: hypothetical protein MI755_16535 [Sphingomonadales bacterium]|nr:hypothetical protein [Sphingomonadales bacterium]